MILLSSIKLKTIFQTVLQTLKLRYMILSVYWNYVDKKLRLGTSNLILQILVVKLSLVKFSSPEILFLLVIVVIRTKSFSLLAF